MAHDAVQPSDSIARALFSSGWPSVRVTSVCVRLLLLRLVGLVFIGVSVASLLPRVVKALADPHLLIIFESRSVLGHAGNFVTWLGSGFVASGSGSWVVMAAFEVAGIAAGALLYCGRTQTILQFLGRSKQ